MPYKTFRGVEFYYHYDPDHRASFDSFGDEENVRERWWKIRSGDVVFDIGAAYGSYALPACALGATVYAFSPEFDHDTFVQSVKENHFENRCFIYKFGFYSKYGYINPATQEYTTELADSMIPVQILDDFVQSHHEINKIDWMKLDVEGAELEVLSGGVGTIRQFRPRILVENHLFKKASLENDVIAYIDSLNLQYSHESFPYHSVSHTLFTPE